MSVTTYRVDGMTCGHCVSTVVDALRALDGVSAVTVDLSPGSASTVSVTSPTPLADDQVLVALDEAGDYRLVDIDGA